MSSRYPPQFPPVWAVAWGDDPYGLWAELRVDKVVQRMRWIESGEFDMGSPEDEPERYGNEGPQHRVRISEGFWLADSACTQALWLAVMGGDPRRAYLVGDLQNPVERASWDDVSDFLCTLQRKLPEGGEPLLPTEAQWEYACRAGTRTPFNLGENVTVDQVNYDGNHPYLGGAKGKWRERAMPVKSLAPNGWGLYEMHGNVWEWCADSRRTYDKLEEGVVLQDPTGPSSALSGMRAVRGGSWINYPQSARSAYRGTIGRGIRRDIVGFRLALRS